MIWVTATPPFQVPRNSSVRTEKTSTFGWEGFVSLAWETPSFWTTPGARIGSCQARRLQTNWRYAAQRNLDFSNPGVRSWYAAQQQHYLEDGVSFFWNGEGETAYFSFHWWNVAQLQSWRSVSVNRRFYSSDRAWQPGTARMGGLGLACADARHDAQVLGTGRVGVFMPTMRVHSVIDATPYFHWLWGDFAEPMRKALNLRYQLVPNHYSLAHQMHDTGKL